MGGVGGGDWHDTVLNPFKKLLPVSLNAILESLNRYTYWSALGCKHTVASGPSVEHQLAEANNIQTLSYSFIVKSVWRMCDKAYILSYFYSNFVYEGKACRFSSGGQRRNRSGDMQGVHPSFEWGPGGDSRTQISQDADDDDARLQPVCPGLKH